MTLMKETICINVQKYHLYVSVYPETSNLTLQITHL